VNQKILLSVNSYYTSKCNNPEIKTGKFKNLENLAVKEYFLYLLIKEKLGGGKTDEYSVREKK